MRGQSFYASITRIERYGMCDTVVYDLGIHNLCTVVNLHDKSGHYTVGKLSRLNNLATHQQYMHLGISGNERE
jgi:uncharacterized protein (DUF2237 family)